MTNLGQLSTIPLKKGQNDPGLEIVQYDGLHPLNSTMRTQAAM